MNLGCSERYCLMEGSTQRASTTAAWKNEQVDDQPLRWPVHWHREVGEGLRKARESTERSYLRTIVSYEYSSEAMQSSK